jgi:hypothetical protein
LVALMLSSSGRRKTLYSVQKELTMKEEVKTDIGESLLLIYR